MMDQSEPGRERIMELPSFVWSIVIECCRSHDISPETLFGPGRARNVSACRHEVFYRLKERNPSRSWSRIASWLGFDHTTVLRGAAVHAMKHDLPQFGDYDLNTHSRRSRARAFKAYRRIARAA